MLVTGSEAKEKKGVKKNVIDTHEKIILILLLKNISHQKMLRYSNIDVNLQ